MIDIATSLAVPRVKGAITAAANSAAGDFTLTLAAVAGKESAPTDEKVYAPPTDLPVPVPADTTPYADIVLLDLSGKRQRIAGGGKDAPRKSAPDEDDAAKDVIWSPVVTVLPLPTPVMPIALPTLGGTIASAVGEGTPRILTSSVIPAFPAQAGGQVSEAIAKSLPYPDWAPASAGEAPAAATVVLKGDPAAPTALRDSATIDLLVRIDATRAPAAQQSAPAPITQLASQAFAAALAAAVQSRRDEREPTDAHTPLAVAAAALEAVHQPAVAAAADAKQGALDLRQDSGLHGMIDRIERLRDDANARDTRIRLIPDALGAVEVSVRKDGERVHVHFAADNQASARLLNDAQPRLADLAEARGVKLGQTTVGPGTDSGAGNARQQQQPTRISPTTPAALPGADYTDSTDTRIA